jgi:hypothetical protein
MHLQPAFNACACRNELLIVGFLKSSVASSSLHGGPWQLAAAHDLQ